MSLAESFCSIYYLIVRIYTSYMIIFSRTKKIVGTFLIWIFLFHYSVFAHKIFTLNDLTGVKPHLEALMNQIKTDAPKFDYYQTESFYYLVESLSDTIKNLSKKHKYYSPGEELSLDSFLNYLERLQTHPLYKSNYEQKYDAYFKKFKDSGTDFSLEKAIHTFGTVIESTHLLSPPAVECRVTMTVKQKVKELLDDPDSDAFETVKSLLTSKEYALHNYHIVEFFPTQEEYNELLISDKVQPLIKNLLNKPRISSIVYNFILAQKDEEDKLRKQDKKRALSEGIYDAINITKLLLSLPPEEIAQIDRTFTEYSKSYLESYDIKSLSDFRNQVYNALHDDFVKDHDGKSIPNELKKLAVDLQAQGLPSYDVVISKLFGSHCLHGFTGLKEELYSREYFLRYVENLNKN